MDFFELVRRLHQTKLSPFELFEDVTPTEARALLMIGTMLRCDGAESVRPGRIAERMFVTPSALSQVLKSLERKGLVERAHDAKDSRSVSLTLTEPGRSLSAKIDECWTAQAHAVVDYVGAAELRALMETALRVCEYFEKTRTGEIPSPFGDVHEVFGGGSGVGSGAAACGGVPGEGIRQIVSCEAGERLCV